MNKFTNKKYTIIFLLVLAVAIAGFLATAKKPAVTALAPSPVVSENLASLPPKNMANKPVSIEQAPISQGPVKPVQPTIQPKTLPVNNISITIRVGNSSMLLFPTAGATLFDDLSQAGKAGTLVFSGKEYPGLGFFVAEIGDLKNGNGKNLIYYINGKEASVGVSTYVPQNGDIVEWKLE